MREEVEVLKALFAAINRKDMQEMTRDVDPGIMRIEPAGFPTSGTCRGIAQASYRGPRQLMQFMSFQGGSQ